MYQEDDKPLTRLAVAINETIAALVESGYTDPEPALLSILGFIRAAFSDQLAGDDRDQALQLVNRLAALVRYNSRIRNN